LLVLAVGIGLPTPVAAGPEDIEITLEIAPSVAGSKGGDMELIITAKNKGSTLMKVLDVSVTTMSGFLSGWNVTVPVGGSRTRVFNVHFDAEDLGVDKLLIVKFDNTFPLDDGSVNGTYAKIFRVNGTSSITEFVGGTASSHALLTGTPFPITMSIRNAMERPLYDFTTEFFILDDDNNHILDIAAQNHGVLGAGSTKNVTFSYTPQIGHEGVVTVAYELNYTYLGESYREVHLAQGYTVAQPQRLDIFPTLTPQALIFEPDVMQQRTVVVVSEGNMDIDEIEVQRLSGSVVATGGALLAGDTVTMTFETAYDELGAFEESYIVEGRGPGFVIRRPTNTITVTVRELLVPVPLATEEGAADPTGEAAESSESPSENTSENGQSAEQAAQENAESESDEITEETSANGNLALYIIIGVLGLLVAAAAITVPILLRKNKKKGTGKRKDTL